MNPNFPDGLSVHDQTLVRRVGKVCKGVDNRSEAGEGG